MPAPLDFLNRPASPPESLPFGLHSAFSGHRYQAWIVDTVRPHLGKRILELGAGIGALSRWMQGAERLALVEPDPAMAGFLEQWAPGWLPRAEVTVHRMAPPAQPLSTLAGQDFDTVISFNVLEHIEDDLAVLKDAAGLLRNSRAAGPRRLVSFVPAHPWAYGTVDRYDLHVRRYTKAGLLALAAAAAPECSVRILPFNFFGLWAWIYTGRVRKVSGEDMAGEGRAFELLLPFLKPMDTLLMRGLRFPWGLSYVCVWEWPAR
jgi:SAM-dependent methyltransferase